jgi:hypothetical protein
MNFNSIDEDLNEYLRSNDAIVKELCIYAVEMQGHMKANSIVLNSLVRTVFENAPELIEQIKEKIIGTTELSVSLRELSSSVAIETLQKEIDQYILRFSLITDAAKHLETYIEVKSKS